MNYVILTFLLPTRDDDFSFTCCIGSCTALTKHFKLKVIQLMVEKGNQFTCLGLCHPFLGFLLRSVIFLVFMICILPEENAIAFKKDFTLEILHSPASNQRAGNVTFVNLERFWGKEKGWVPLKDLNQRAWRSEKSVTAFIKCLGHIPKEKSMYSLLSVGTILRKGANLRTLCVYLHY